jgi:hypothetical protein
MWTFRQCPNGWYFDCISSDPANWGVFGDYFNWIIGFVNLVLLVKLTQIANDLLKSNTTKQIKAEIIKDIIKSIDQNRDSLVAAWSNNRDVKGIRQHILLLHAIFDSASWEFKVLLDNDADKANLSEIERRINNCKTGLTTLMEDIKKPQGSFPNLISAFFTEISELKLLLYQEIKRS